MLHPFESDKQAVIAGVEVADEEGAMPVCDRKRRIGRIGLRRYADGGVTEVLFPGLSHHNEPKLTQ